VKTSPLVSVIIPAYNHAQYITKCLESLYTDDYPSLEVIVLDDGSTDETFAVAQAWREQNPGHLDFRLERQENKGIAATLNRLIGWAHGEYIVLLASDDYVLVGGIQARVDVLNAHSEWLAVFCDCRVVNQHDQILAESGLTYLGANKRALATKGKMRLELLLNWAMPGPVIMMRRAAFDPVIGVGLYDENLGFEDRDFYLRILSRDALGFLDTQVSAYRLHGKNFVSSRQTLGSLTKYRTDLKHLKNFQGIERFALVLSGQRSLFAYRIKNSDRLNFTSLLAYLGWALTYSSAQLMLFLTPLLSKLTR
jgi:glycosyltransferase involved in cell wall biosynthesis